MENLAEDIPLARFVAENCIPKSSPSETLTSNRRSALVLLPKDGAILEVFGKWL